MGNQILHAKMGVPAEGVNREIVSGHLRSNTVIVSSVLITGRSGFARQMDVLTLGVYEVIVFSYAGDHVLQDKWMFYLLVCED